jgi:hypothetical protein
MRFMLRRSAVLIAVVGCLAAVAVAGCGSKNRSSVSNAAAATAPAGTTTHFAKTKFVLHAGLGFGAFHHYIYEPFRAGDFKHPFSHKLVIVEASLAAGFVYHELKLAATDVRSSKVLSTLFAPLTIVADKTRGLVSEVRGGNTSQVDSVNSSLASIKSTAASNGQSITDQIPTAGQLASGGA